MIALQAASGPFRGETTVPGDKSIGHRAIILAALSRGRSRIVGLSGGADNRCTLDIFRALGVDSAFASGIRAPDELQVEGVGLRGLRAPARVLDCGNSGTTARLMSGLLAAQPFESTLDGDESLRSRPMRRVVEPLSRMGARFVARQGDRLPMTVHGGALRGIDYTVPVASAQVKSALLLAGLYAGGETVVREPGHSRDHTERMLRAVGAPLAMESGAIRIRPPDREFLAADYVIPGDVSSAALIAAAALIAPGSEIRVNGVGLNPTRTGVLDVWRAMGATIACEAQREVCGEPVGDVVVRASDLVATEIGGNLALRSIDEIPVIAVTAAFARGTTIVRDAAELRVKETDRVAAIVALLRAFGVAAHERSDGLVVEGTADGVAPLKAGAAESRGDHRIAMCAALLALRAPAGSTVSEIASVATSFPGFFNTLGKLAAGWKFATP